MAKKKKTPEAKTPEPINHGLVDQRPPEPDDEDEEFVNAGLIDGVNHNVPEQ